MYNDIVHVVGLYIVLVSMIFPLFDGLEFDSIAIVLYMHLNKVQQITSKIEHFHIGNSAKFKIQNPNNIHSFIH